MKKHIISRLFVRSVIAASVSTAFLGFSSTAYASGYQVLNYFYSAVAAGDSGAGGAALAEDASTSFTNPAGLVRLPCPQLVLVGSALNVDTKFRGSNTWSLVPGAFPIPIPSYTETGTAQGGVLRFLPAFHFAMPIAPCWRFGFSAAPTYGLATMYENNSIVRYNTTKTELKVLDLSPAIAYQINRQFSVGAGVDFANATLIYRAVAGIPPLGLFNDALSKNTADAWGYGGHVGVLYQMDPCTRFGLHYRSKMNIDIKGKSVLTGRGLIENGAISVNNFRTTLILPPITTLSAYHDFTPCWAVDASINYTQWNLINNGSQTLYNIATPTPVNATIPWNYKNTWLTAVGTSYRINQLWLLRTGVQYDQSPIKSSQRLLAIPDSNRWGVSVGAHYQFCRTAGFDMGWTHLFLRDASMSAPTVIGPQVSTPNGTSKSHADIVSAQITVNL